MRAYREAHPVTEETRKKLSFANKGKKLSEETKQKISIARLGMKRKPSTEETLRNISLTQKGKIVTTETKAKLSKAHKGKKLSPETREKMSITRQRKAQKERKMKEVRRQLVERKEENYPEWQLFLEGCKKV